ncbi:hypothetical protein Afil01_39330 [Actinorhabdospora filicis]|uniref:Repeat protein (TIGR03847 family) n=1 Tax=Actinorhabdospora filicis TaxID=1785913 RepID=A0A9W6SNF3_9ACTN|nr:DUF3090 domain-containing protein [Actinorhabdospora filicis]GLZ79126.1 hypothetical protein Afil01_39330 [Actinorhabdospora filicis]
MTGQLYEFLPPERFVAGTVGEPGERTFFLQARGGGRVVSVALEKGQVRLLADRIDELLGEAARRFGAEVEGSAPVDHGPLDTPIEEEFRVGAIGLGWDAESELVVVEMIQVPEDEDVEPDDEKLDRMRVQIAPAVARAFATRARSVVAAGRPPCPWCGGPIDVAGHLCPRSNGYRRREDGDDPVV